MYRIEYAILFEKYRIHKVIGSGRTGTVFLAEHLGLQELRAIKRVSKACPEYESFRREAFLLKGFRHPGIPIIYDIEEDLEYGYLILEFIQGESLSVLLKKTGHLQETKVISYGIQICQVINYLHSFVKNPILYLDLQPDNLLISQENVKLIDFNHALPREEAGRILKRYGTLGCAAPEQYTGEPLDQRTDIYAIGCILYYMTAGILPGDNPEHPADTSDGLWEIIDTCLKKNPSDRYDSAELAREQLESLKACREAANQPSSLIVVISGSKPGCGATCLAVGLMSWLARNRITCLYEEHNLSGAVRRLAEYEGIVMDRPEDLSIRGLMWKPYYGGCVAYVPGTYQVIIRDYGVDTEAVVQDVQAEVKVLAAGGSCWEWQAGIGQGKLLAPSGRFCMVWNHSEQAIYRAFPKEAKGWVHFRMPYIQDLFKGSPEGDSFYGALWSWIIKGRKGWEVRNLDGNTGQSLIRRIFGRWG